MPTIALGDAITECSDLGSLSDCAEQNPGVFRSAQSRVAGQ